MSSRRAPGITQVLADYCSCHAVGEAVVEAAWRQYGKDFRVDLNRQHKYNDNRKGVVDILIAKRKCSGPGRYGIWPTWFDGLEFKLHDKNHDYYWVKISCKEVQYHEVNCNTKKGAFAIVYDVNGDKERAHAIFVKEERGNNYVGNNYEGRATETLIPKDQANHFYSVQVELTYSHPA